MLAGRQKEFYIQGVLGVSPNECVLRYISRRENVRQNAYLANTNAVQERTAFQRRSVAECGT